MSKYRIKDTHNIRINWKKPQIIGDIVEITDEKIQYNKENGGYIHPEGNKYGINFELNDFELVEESKPKFKVGDRVKYINKEKDGYNISFWKLGGYGTVTDLGQEQGGTKSFNSEKSVYVTIDQEYTEREDTRDSVVSKDSLELIEEDYLEIKEVKTNTYSRSETIPGVAEDYYLKKCGIAYGVPVYATKSYVDSSAFNNNAPQEQTNNNMNQGLISKMKDLLMNEPKKTLLKYGIIDREENLTSEGKELFINFMFEQNKDKFIDEVVSVFVKAEEKDSKKK